MKQDVTKFYAIYKNGNYIESTNLKELTHLPDYEYLVKKEFHHDYTTSFKNTHNWYRYAAIDGQANDKPIKIGKFECIDLGYQDGTYNFFGITSKILDSQKKTIHDIRSKTPTIEFIKKELIPAMEKLNDFGNWESYQTYLDNIKLIKENSGLINKIETLEKEIEVLENKLSDKQIL
jgi:hypothetical protein